MMRKLFRLLNNLRWHLVVLPNHIAWRLTDILGDGALAVLSWVRARQEDLMGEDDD